MVAVTSHAELGEGRHPRAPHARAERASGAGSARRPCSSSRRANASRWRPSYKVEIPAGTRAASGHALGESGSFSFTTPSVVVKQVNPTAYEDPSDLEPIVFMELNQRIDKNALLGSIELRGEKSQSFPVRLATADEIEKDDATRELSQHAEADRWLAFRPVSPLPKGTYATVVLRTGAPSAEGPRKTEKDQSSNFRVRGPLRFESVSCGWSEGCPPLAPWTVYLSNAIEAGGFDPKMVTVDPPVQGLRIDVSGRYLTLRGRTKGRTHYTINLSAEIKDVFGQNLEQPATGKLDVSEAEPLLFSEQDEMMVLDPAFEPKLSVYSVNQRQLKVRLYSVAPHDWDDYMRFRHDYDWDGRLTQPPGKLVVTRTVQPKGERDALVETQIDLRPMLKDGFGQVLAIVEPPNQPKPRNRWDYRSRQWVASLAAGHQARTHRATRRRRDARLGERSRDGRAPSRARPCRSPSIGPKATRLARTVWRCLRSAKAVRT